MNRFVKAAKDSSLGDQFEMKAKWDTTVPASEKVTFTTSDKGAAGITYDAFREKYQDYFFTINERTPEKEAFIRNYLKTHK